MSTLTPHEIERLRLIDTKFTRSHQKVRMELRREAYTMLRNNGREWQPNTSDMSIEQNVANEFPIKFGNHAQRPGRFIEIVPRLQGQPQFTEADVASLRSMFINESMGMKKEAALMGRVQSSLDSLLTEQRMNARSVPLPVRRETQILLDKLDKCSEDAALLDRRAIDLGVASLIERDRVNGTSYTNQIVPDDIMAGYDPGRVKTYVEIGSPHTHGLGRKVTPIRGVSAPAPQQRESIPVPVESTPRRAIASFMAKATRRPVAELSSSQAEID